MSKYSFVLQGTEPEYFELLPTLRLRKYGGWLVAEAIEQEELNKNQSQSTIRAVQLAKRIAAAKEIPLVDAFDLLQGKGSGGLSEMDLLEDFAEETMQMLEDSGGAEVNNAKTVTTFIRCRGEALIDGEWARVDDWSIEDTKELSRPLIMKVIEFIGNEQQQEVEGESLGKAQTPKKKKTSPSPKGLKEEPVEF